MNGKQTKRHIQFSTYDVEMSIPYRVHAEISSKDNIWALCQEIGKILRELCRRKGVEIIEAYAMPDHIHMMVSIPPNERVSLFMGYLKGKSTMIIFERYAKLKYKYGNRHFWSRGYYVSTIGGNKQAVQKYIQNQEKEDMINNQIGLVEYYDPFAQWLESIKKKEKKK